MTELELAAIKDLESTLQERGLWDGVLTGMSYRGGKVSGFFADTATPEQKLSVANLLNGWDFSAAGHTARNKERAKAVLNSPTDTLPLLLRAVCNVVRKELNRLNLLTNQSEAEFLAKVRNELGGN